MAKRKNQEQSILLLLSTFLGLVALVMIFLPAVKYYKGEFLLGGGNPYRNYSGLDIAFGGKAEKITNVKPFGFSIMALLSYVLALGGVITSFLCYKSKGNKLLAFITVGVFVVSAVLFFLIPNFIVLPKLTILVKDNFSLAIGSIIGGIASALAGLCSLGEVMKK